MIRISAMVPRRLSVSLVLAVSLALPGLSFAQSPADVAAARDLFREGAKHAQDQRWADARAAYTKSLALKRAPLTLYSLGVANQNLGRFVEALESYRAFLYEMDPKNDAFKPYEQPARDAIAELEKKVGRIELKFLPVGIEPSSVTVDGEAIPKAALSVARVVDPGEHVIVANAPNRREARSTVKVSEGQLVTLDIKLFPILGPKPPPPKPPPPPPPNRTTQIVGYSMMGGGAALFIAGLAVGLVGVQKATDAPSQKSTEADEARRLGLVGDVVGGLGAATALTGFTLWLTETPLTPADPAPADPASAAPPVSVRPSVSPGFVGVVGRF